MAEVPQRRLGEMLQQVLTVLAAEPDGLPVQTVIDQVARRLSLTPFEQQPYPNQPQNKRRFDKLLRFATIYPVKAGWLVKDHGTWRITAAGRSALAEHPEPLALKRAVNRLYKTWQSRQPRAGDESLPDEETVPRDVAVTVEEAQDTAWTEISRYIYVMDPYEFQDLVAALLRAMRYHVPWTAPRGHSDGGRDLLAYTDPLGTRGPRIVVQVRNREKRADADDIRGLLAVLGDSDVGLFVSSSGFTSEAEREARAQERRRLTLIDLPRLVDLWIGHYQQLTDAERAQLPLTPVYFLAPRS
jgi:restriction system protein